MRCKRKLIFILFCYLAQNLAAQKNLELGNGNLRLNWTNSGKGFELTKLSVTSNGKRINYGRPSGEFTLLFSEKAPDTASLVKNYGPEVAAFPDSTYKYIVKTWRDNLRPVPMNTAGTAFHFYPGEGKKLADGGIEFSAKTEAAMVVSDWAIEPGNPFDIRVTITVTALKSGYFSLPTPTLATINESELRWGIIPGLFQGAGLESNLVSTYAYGQGIPNKPVIVRERTASTLSPILSTKNGLSFTVIPEPGTSRDPWASNANTHSVWQLGLSLMNRKSELTPTAYHPVLGETGSYLKQGEKSSFSFRYSLQVSDWFTVFNHAANDIYHLSDFLQLKKTRQSLTSRILSMQEYLHNDSSSLWRVEQFNNRKIGAQAYLGGVIGSDRDAMKNSDYGAMWMLANITGDKVLLDQRLPYARNFKLEQQQSAPGFFQGAAVGQYYLSKSHRFTEEWGDYVEPMALTYYSMLDIGNILLFDSLDSELKGRLKLGAEKLLQWQHTDGSWEVGYDRASEKVVFKDLKDYRPTFYGLIVAYRILHEKKYLDAAIKGADWFIKEASSKGFFLGVCGDLRFAPDFATAQSSQSMLDLYDLTGNKKYQEAAINIARQYTTSIYTHPIASNVVKTVNGRQREDWEISEVGLSFEHGGSVGSANIHGPILLASHAGLFVRMFSLTKDSIFINMARAAALGRDAFVDSATSVASYYWDAMNRGAGPYPHHAWWQVGWLTDYLLSEISLRSGGKISFPQGFVTPKVGPHKSYGFKPGNLFGKQVSLVLNKEMVAIKDPYIDYFGARSADGKETYLIMLNDDDESRTVDLDLGNANGQPKTITMLDQSGKTISEPKAELHQSVAFPPYSLRIMKITR